jgi:hypothetical protein
VNEHSARRLYHDDGISLSYQEGNRSVRDVRLSVDPGEIRVAVVDEHRGYDGAPAEYPLVLHDDGGREDGVAAAAAEGDVDRVVFRRGD